MIKKLTTGIAVFAFLMATGWIMTSCNQSQSVKSLSQAPGPDFQPLFNGEDFTGWNIEPDSGAWYVKDAQIHCTGERKGPYIIRTEKEYENYDFYAEFKVSKGCNSGITFHLPIVGGGRESKLGFEAQIMDDSGKPPTKNSTGSVYDQIPPKKNAMKPAGEWNQYRILFDWPTCKIWLNGEQVQDADFSAYPHLKHRLRKGALGVSNHGHVVHYRNLYIKELPGKEEWQTLFNGKDLSNWDKIGNADWHVEDDMIVATRGEGYLVSKDEFKDFHFQAYMENDTLQTRGGAFYYRWNSVIDPGYSVEFFDFPKAANLILKYGLEVPWGKIAPTWRYNWLLYQILSTDREAEIRVAGRVVATNTLLNKVRPGKIAIYHSPADGVVRLKNIKIKQLESMGL